MRNAGCDSPRVSRGRRRQSPAAKPSRNAADWFLSTDDRLLRRAVRVAGSLKVAVANPADWVLTHLA